MTDESSAEPLESRTIRSYHAHMNRAGLSVLVHPNTGRARDDHERNPLWLGAPLELLTESLPNEPGTDGISDVVVNTSPTLPAA